MAQEPQTELDKTDLEKFQVGKNGTENKELIGLGDNENGKEQDREQDREQDNEPGKEPMNLVGDHVDDSGVSGREGDDFTNFWKDLVSILDGVKRDSTNAEIGDGVFRARVALDVRQAMWCCYELKRIVGDSRRP